MIIVIDDESDGDIKTAKMLAVVLFSSICIRWVEFGSSGRR